MKSAVMVSAVLVWTACTTAPRSSSTAHRIVMEVSSDDPSVWEAALNNAENLRKALGEETAIEVVAHGAGLGMLLHSNTAQGERMQRLAAAGIAFRACENTMRKKNVTPEDLLSLVTTVDSGVAEVVRKQEAGWSYVKSGG